MSKTPTRSVVSAPNFVPKEISTPNKDQPGLSKTIFSHVSNLHGLLKDWVKIKDKGVKFCRGISSVKLHECSPEYYPQQLEPLTKGLIEALNGLNDIVEGVNLLNNQLKALAKLQPSDQPVIFTWSALHISEGVTKLYKSLVQEFHLKELVVENIAHCRDEKLIEVYISSWEFDAYLNWNSTAYLFAECGLASIA
ncbi:hypothetical protein K1T71_007788 [Dendrolimus kikuchii]|uniref:Uncharacterized protein n=1 Tax=Dendrolimus kikuchii TaxID=765133 RepID=A0ACC1CY00_9NEOP|nr:hypothetical protein K1T71_007788 [Dendrolimus kikuchii]